MELPIQAFCRSYLSEDLQSATVFTFSLQVVSFSRNREGQIKYYIQCAEYFHFTQHPLNFLLPRSAHKAFRKMQETLCKQPVQETGRSSESKINLDLKCYTQQLWSWGGYTSILRSVRQREMGIWRCHQTTWEGDSKPSLGQRQCLCNLIS